jgi:prepilin-type N-terminal cleavage/methylation domain-containing protein
MKNFKNYKNQAFSLIELSIVILIIGILVAGVTQSSRLIRQMQLSSARALTLSSPVLSIPNLVSWYEPTQEKSFDEVETSENSLVSKWYDLSLVNSTKIDLIQTDSARRPIYVSNAVNGLPSLRFNGVNTYLQTNGFFPEHNSPTFTFFAVTQNAVNSASTHKAIFCDRYGYGSFMSGWVMYSFANQYFLFFGSGGPSWIEIFAQPIVNGQADILTIVYDKVNVVIYKNSTNPVTRATGYVLNTLRPSGVGSVTACDTADNFFFNGYISEIILYNRNLKNDERIDVEKYLAKKWAIKI